MEVVVEASEPKGDHCARQHPFKVGGKDPEGWRRTFKDVLPSRIEPWTPPQSVFECL